MADVEELATGSSVVDPWHIRMASAYMWHSYWMGQYS